MNAQKTKSIQDIELRMETLEPDSFRYKVLDSAKSFKSSWIELGQYLFTIYKDKMFKDWGYLTFEAYCAKEIGIRQATALKLLKSYSFLEREEPAFLKNQSLEETKPSQIPSYESVNALRLAKASDLISESDYKKIREDILENPKEDTEVKKKIRYILKSHSKPLSDEQKEEKKGVTIKRILTSLRNTKNELQELSFPVKVVKQIEQLIDVLSEFQK